MAYSNNWRENILSLKDKKNVIFSTSFSIEDQVITDFIVNNDLNIEIFTIDTGRLFEETYKLWAKTTEKYNLNIKAYYPDSEVLQDFITKNGVNSFYSSKDLRKECCNIRKVQSLHKALKGKEIWISGIRKEHSPNRNASDYTEYDENLAIEKLYPLLNTNESEIWDYIKKNDVPYNLLYDKGYRSIGCSPCTRSSDSSDIRDGRWWWEDGSKECGLHIKDGKVTRG